jgi:PAS domain S-box-containing protein
MAMQTEVTEQLSRRIVEETPDAIIYADRDGLIQLWNAGAEAMFGYEASEAIGQSLDVIVPEKLRARHWEGYHRVMATGETRYGAGDLLAVPGLHKDGSRMSLEFSIAILRDDSDQILGIAAILRNVTARWEQDRALHQRIKELEAQVQGVTT